MKRVVLLVIALSCPALPAVAQGLSLTLVPRSAAEAEVLRLGLTLYALRQGGSGIAQDGRGNAAALLQSGALDGQGQVGIIRQRGRGHRAVLSQTAPGTAHAIIQTGRGTRAVVTQDAPGDVSLTFQHGW